MDLDTLIVRVKYILEGDDALRQKQAVDQKLQSGTSAGGGASPSARNISPGAASPGMPAINAMRSAGALPPGLAAASGYGSVNPSKTGLDAYDTRYENRQVADAMRDRSLAQQSMMGELGAVRRRSSATTESRLAEQERRYETIGAGARYNAFAAAERSAQGSARFDEVLGGIRSGDAEGFIGPPRFTPRIPKGMLPLDEAGGGRFSGFGGRFALLMAAREGMKAIQDRNAFAADTTLAGTSQSALLDATLNYRGKLAGIPIAGQLADLMQDPAGIGTANLRAVQASATANDARGASVVAASNFGMGSREQANVAAAGGPMQIWLAAESKRNATVRDAKDKRDAAALIDQKSENAQRSETAAGIQSSVYRRFPGGGAIMPGDMRQQLDSKIMAAADEVVRPTVAAHAKSRDSRFNALSADAQTIFNDDMREVRMAAFAQAAQGTENKIKGAKATLGSLSDSLTAKDNISYLQGVASHGMVTFDDQMTQTNIGLRGLAQEAGVMSPKFFSANNAAIAQRGALTATAEREARTSSAIARSREFVSNPMQKYEQQKLDFNFAKGLAYEQFSTEGEQAGENRTLQAAALDKYRATIGEIDARRDSQILSQKQEMAGLMGQSTSLSLALARKPHEAQAQEIVNAANVAQLGAGDNARRIMIGSNAANAIRLLAQNEIDSSHAVAASPFRDDFTGQGGNKDRLLESMNEYLKQIADHTQANTGGGLAP